MGLQAGGTERWSPVQGVQSGVATEGQTVRPQQELGPLSGGGGSCHEETGRLHDVPVRSGLRPECGLLLRDAGRGGIPAKGTWRLHDEGAGEVGPALPTGAGRVDGAEEQRGRHEVLPEVGLRHRRELPGQGGQRGVRNYEQVDAVGF
uniref:(northern house mosquito) hypothetical protein n=1 Tax=Culex pipiens TaxID=7175 RepID=A0A8D8IJY9_CULPI